MSSGVFRIFHGPLEGADLATFQVLDGILARDQFRIYSFGYPLENIDPATFQKVSGADNPYCFYKDKDHLYSCNGDTVPTEGLDLVSASMLSDTVVGDADGTQCMMNTKELEQTICSQM